MKKLTITVLLLMLSFSLASCENLGNLQGIFGDKLEDLEDLEDLPSGSLDEDDLEDLEDGFEALDEILNKALEQFKLPELKSNLCLSLPKESFILRDCHYTYELIGNVNVTLEDYILTVGNLKKDENFTMRVTVSYKGLTLSKDLELVAKVDRPMSILEFLNQELETKHKISGVVVAVDKRPNGKRGFVLCDGTSAIFCYNQNYDFDLGDKIVINAEVSDYYGNKEVKRLNLITREKSHNYEKVSGEATRFTANELFSDIQNIDQVALIAKYSHKFIELEGTVLNENGRFVFREEGVQMGPRISIFADLSDYENQRVVLRGYFSILRDSYADFYVQSVKEAL